MNNSIEFRSDNAAGAALEILAAIEAANRGSALAIGELLMFSAIRRAVEGADQIGSWALVTDPKDDTAQEFYERFDFRPLSSGRLFLPMADAAEWISTR